MAGSDEGIPEPVADKPADLTGEVSMLPPEEAAEVIAEIRAVAEARGEDSEVVELVGMPPSGRSRRPSSITLLPPLSTGELKLPEVLPPPAEDDELSVEELRDAWPLLDLDERGDGLRVLPRED